MHLDQDVLQQLPENGGVSELTSLQLEESAAAEERDVYTNTHADYWPGLATSIAHAHIQQCTTRPTMLAFPSNMHVIISTAYTE